MRVTPAGSTSTSPNNPAHDESLTSSSSPRKRVTSRSGLDTPAVQPLPSADSAGPAAVGLRRRGYSSSHEHDAGGSSRGRWAWHSPFLRKPMSVVVGVSENGRQEAVVLVLFMFYFPTSPLNQSIPLPCRRRRKKSWRGGWGCTICSQSASVAQLEAGYSSWQGRLPMLLTCLQGPLLSFLLRLRVWGVS